MVRTVLSTLPGKLAAAAAGLTFATTGLAAASALPGPLQQVVSDVGGVVGVELPTTDGSTPTTEGTTPTTEGSTPTTTTPTTVGTGTTPTTGGSTPTTGSPPLAAAATTAAQAAQIHDFDEACGNHGAYVSFVARNGTEPSCAAEVRNGTPTPTVPGPEVGDDDSGQDAEDAASDRSGPSAKAGKGSGASAQPGNSGSKGSSGR